MRAIPIAAVVLGLLLAGCTPTRDSDSSGPSTASPTPSPEFPSTPVSSAPSAVVGGAGWMPSADIPLSAKYHWPDLADSAQTVISPQLRFEELCHSTFPEYREHLESQGDQARRAQSPAQDSSDWQVQQTIFTWQPDPTDPHGADNGRYMFNELQSEIEQCGSAVARLGSDGTSLDYTISSPDDVIAHGYLVWAPGHCALSELVLWASGQQATRWTADDAATTSAALAGALRTLPRCT